jgi:hypothetical protein
VFETRSNCKITYTLSVCISKSNSLLLFRQMATFCFKNQMEFINTLCDSALLLRHLVHIPIPLFYVVNSYPVNVENRVSS